MCAWQGCSDPPVATGTLASLRGGKSGWVARKVEKTARNATSGQTSGHAWTFPQSPEEPWCVALATSHWHSPERTLQHLAIIHPAVLLQQCQHQSKERVVGTTKPVSDCPDHQSYAVIIRIMSVSEQR
jgi:hypothetical protein